MPTTDEELRDIALIEFTSAGYAATSLARIAEIAGLSKSSVLYHFSSKETLLEATVTPAIQRMEQILEGLPATMRSPTGRAGFLSEFVDFILEYRREVNMFINQGPSLVDVPVIDRANEVVHRLAEFFAANTASIEDKMRFGIALGGAAYMLCSPESMAFGADQIGEARAALLAILSELLAPVRIPAAVSEVAE